MMICEQFINEVQSYVLPSMLPASYSARVPALGLGQPMRAPIIYAETQFF